MINQHDILKDRVALVTGASKGIGKAIAAVFAMVGASVACVARTEERLRQTVEEIRNRGGQALAVPGDVTNEDDVQRVSRETVAHFGKLNVVPLALFLASQPDVGPTAQSFSLMRRET